MNPRILHATTWRILRQLTRDKRTLALVLVVPSLLLSLLYYVFTDNKVLFNAIAPLMVSIFPMFILLVVASVTMQRERSSGKLERLLTTRMHRADLIGGYAIALSTLAVLQSLLLFIVSDQILEVPTNSPSWLTIITSVVSGIVGIALGILGSSFARNEFQAVQLIPVLIIPQVFLCGLLVDRDQLPSVLKAISDALPMSYAVDASAESAANGFNSTVLSNLAFCSCFGIVFLLLSTLTMPRVAR